MLSHFSRVRLFVTPWTVAHQAPLSMGFSWQEYWSGLPFPSAGDLPDPGIEPGSPASPALRVWTLYPLSCLEKAPAAVAASWSLGYRWVRLPEPCHYWAQHWHHLRGNRNEPQRPLRWSLGFPWWSLTSSDGLTLCTDCWAVPKGLALRLGQRAGKGRVVVKKPLWVQNMWTDLGLVCRSLRRILPCPGHEALTLSATGSWCPDSDTGSVTYPSVDTAAWVHGKSAHTFSEWDGILPRMLGCPWNAVNWYKIIACPVCSKQHPRSCWIFWTTSNIQLPKESGALNWSLIILGLCVCVKVINRPWFVWALHLVCPQLSPIATQTKPPPLGDQRGRVPCADTFIEYTMVGVTFQRSWLTRLGKITQHRAEVPLLCNRQVAQLGERRKETPKQQVGRSAPGAAPAAVKAGKGLASCRDRACCSYPTLQSSPRSRLEPFYLFFWIAG